MMDASNSDSTFTLGLIGKHLRHSRSPELFDSIFEHSGVKGDYRLFELADIDEIKSLISAHPALRGFNVTVPYKKAILPHLTSLSPEAAAIGAVNTVKIVKIGDEVNLNGYNTDVDGVMASLEGMRADTFSAAFILGSGGASAACEYAMRQYIPSVRIVSRNPSGHHISYTDFNERLRSRPTGENIVLINATPLGMWPNTDTYPEVDFQAVRAGDFCFDLVYNPAVTRFLELCATRGACVKNGLQMLESQALAAWKIWNGD